MIEIVDVGLGNSASVENMLRRLGYETRRSSHPPKTDLDGVKYVLPGVGSYDEGVRRLEASGWYDVLRELPASTHVLGICLGMQLLGSSSDEGMRAGLGRVAARFVRFDDVPRIPHMGWNTVITGEEDAIFDTTLPELRYYFTHSFHAVCSEGTRVIGITEYGAPFVSAYACENTRGVQFHPEKSHRFGMALLSNWASLSC